MKARATLMTFLALCLAQQATAESNGTVVAQNATAAQADFTKIDPTFEFLRQTLKIFGPEAPIFKGGLPEGTDLSGTGALLDFLRPLSAREIERFSQLVKFHNGTKGEPISMGTVYSAFVPWTSLAALAEEPLLRRAEATWHPETPRPLEKTVPASHASGLFWRPDTGVDGTGMLVTVIDSGVDVLHPHLFHADGGSYAWLSPKDNSASNKQNSSSNEQRFSIGLSGIDIDNNQTLDSREILKVLKGTTLHPNGQLGEQVMPEEGNKQFNPATDWLYLDLNGDSRRNAGVGDGYSEGDLAYGEPIFVVDDVNQNGIVDQNERLIRLGSSKIQSVIYSDGTRYDRGRPGAHGLIYAAQDPRAENAAHGTAISSIIVGGQPGYHSRIGMAPGADILMLVNEEGKSYSGSDEFKCLATAQEEGSRIVLHEWNIASGVPVDGSTNIEKAIDESHSNGVIHIAPAGNIGNSHKQRFLELPSYQDSNANQSFNLDFDVSNKREGAPYHAALLEFMWQGSDNPLFSISLPKNERDCLGLINQAGVTCEAGRWMLNLHQGYINYFELATGNYAAATLETTDRGLNYLTIYLVSDSEEGLREGTWNASMSNLITEDNKTKTWLSARISDLSSGSHYGIGWLTQEQNGTLVVPATADSTFTVTAFAGQHDELGNGLDGTTVGSLRNYSSKGPRVDGVPSVSISAPDDPFAALAATPETLAAGYGRSWFDSSRGTSAASAFVAGAFALVMEKHPNWAANRLENFLCSGSTASTADDHARLGCGKLNVQEALYPGERTNNQPEALLAVHNLGRSVSFDANASYDLDGNTLWFRFDIDNDGEWDSNWQLSASMNIPWNDILENEKFKGVLDGKEFVARVEVRDDRGGHAGRIRKYTFTDLLAKCHLQKCRENYCASQVVQGCFDGASNAEKIENCLFTCIQIPDPPISSANGTTQCETSLDEMRDADKYADTLNCRLNLLTSSAAQSTCSNLLLESAICDDGSDIALPDAGIVDAGVVDAEIVDADTDVELDAAVDAAVDVKPDASSDAAVEIYDAANDAWLVDADLEDICEDAPWLCEEASDCNCRIGSDYAPWPWLLLGLPFLIRRRREH